MSAVDVGALRDRVDERLGRQRYRNALPEVALFLVGATSGLQVMGFVFTGLTVICLLVAPAILMIRLTPGTALTLALSMIGFAAFVISALINDLSLVDERVTQWASFAVYFAGFVVLAGRDLTRIFTLAAGIAMGAVIYFRTAGLPFAALETVEELWKYGYAPWVTLLLLFVAVKLRTPVPIQAVLLLLIAGYSLVQSFRSHSLVCIGVAGVLLIGWSCRGLQRWIQMAIMAVLALILATLVPAIAASGMAGEAVQRKQEMQDVSGVPTILAGRTESPLSISAIVAKPLFGWGSAENLTPEIFEHGKSLAISLGFDPTIPFDLMWHLSNGEVSLHSVLFTTWAEGGIFAAMLPLSLFIAALVILWNANRYGQWIAPAVLISVQACWDLLFSPMTYNLLAILAILAVVFAARNLTGTSESSPAEPDEAEVADGGRDVHDPGLDLRESVTSS